MKIARLLPLVVVGFALLAGCSGGPSWMEGKWVPDIDRTTQVAKSDTAANGKDNLLQGAANDLVLALLPMLKGMTVTITNKEIITKANDEEKYVNYEVMSRTSTQCDIKKSDGTIDHYYRDGDEIYTYTTGGASLKFYMMRAPN